VRTNIKKNGITTLKLY